MAADIDPTSPGVEMWASGIPPQTVKGEALGGNPRGLSINMAVWWDDDLCRELLDGNTITKYNPAQGTCTPLMRFEGCSSNNGTKSTPCLQGDIFGDWREEVLMLFTQPHATHDSSSMKCYLHEAHIGQFAIVLHQGASHGLHEVATKEAKLCVGVTCLKSTHEIRCVKVARGFACNKIVFHAFVFLFLAMSCEL